MILVWDPLVRVIHWTLAALVLGNFLNEDGTAWHRYAGYTAAGLVATRLLWGCVSRGHAGFRRWWPGFPGILAYVRASLRGQAKRTLGINPAGAAMAATIWLLVLAMGVTGWMMGLDAFWGESWLEALHAALAYLLLACAGMHVCAVLAMSFAHRENLPRAMVTGRKKAGTPAADETVE
ncbi:cytochrome b/b6 domain-containing protein [Noviherbaspirillum galbum]|uniref:Cytochrome B n=1 Tax=Noviherbaspirillum galbum TaxID=2709383 RepID=A0A6B3SQT5_9BURK|nr:cytochrome b/b6 domain-containing protein [Noviherbaspirillum galbum]NEX61675.1 cytochrome B [Noviherbaspirillum galbum]